MNPGDAIAERLERLEEYVQLLEGLRNQPMDVPANAAALERWLQLAAECCLAVARILISARKLGHAETYRDTIDRLRDAGTLDEELAERIADVASLRNILVHDYLKVDVGRLLSFLSDLDDFRRFAAAVSRYLDR